jgi:CHASE2 domain-containing sensor protein
VLEIDDLEVGLLVENRYTLIQQLGKGGFAVVWEATDAQANGDRKAIRFLYSDKFDDAICFRREFKDISDLNDCKNNFKCDRIVKVESLYPEEQPRKDDDIELHFFVMEKVEGKTLEKLIEESVIKPDTQKLSFGKSIWQFLFCRYPPLRSRITYPEIGNWLEQLAEALVVIHPKIIHCDIKPANIIVKSDGNIKLIDFGAATPTNGDYPFKFDTKSVTRKYTIGYVAPEQETGQPLLASDFYSLGMTILSALTGQEPKNFNSNWRSQFPPELTDFLVRATNPDHTKRHLDAKALLKEAKQVSRSLRRKYGRWNGLRQVVKVLGIAAIATISTLAMRSTGILQNIELIAYDQMLRMRLPVETDPRLLIVAIKPEDYEWMGGRDISNALLTKTIQNLLPNQPRAIAIATRRDQPGKEGIKEFQKVLTANHNIFGVCVYGDGNNKGYVFQPKPITPIGFGNGMEDQDSYHRRQLLFYQDSEDSNCVEPTSFSLLVASHYLRTQHHQGESIQTGSHKLGSALLQRLESAQGAYQGTQSKEYFDGNFQIMIDYRSPKVAETISIREVIAQKLSPDKIRDRIILIGRIDDKEDDLLTPYGKMSGTELKAQMISQLITAAEFQNKHLLKPASFSLDLYLISGLSLLIAYLSWRSTSYQGQRAILIFAPITLYEGCFLMLSTQGLWLGFVPFIITASIAILIGYGYNRVGYVIMGCKWIFQKLSSQR